jgi:peptide/nickel transport system ATP-binding protein
MYLGEIVEQAGGDDLFYDTKHPYTEALLDSVPRPDETVERLDPIAGVMPEAIDPPPGCRFHTRCPDAREVCTGQNPPCRTVTEDGESHRVACFKHGEAFPEVDYGSSGPIKNLERSGVGGTEDRDG